MSAEFAVNLPTALAQLDAYYAANWAVTDWYIDGVVGSDSNNGTTAATPLKTGRELKHRLGPSAEFDHSVTIHVLANGMIDPLVINAVMLKTGIHVDIIGTETVLASDTVFAFLNRSHSVPRGVELTATAIIDLSPYRWKRIRVTSGPRQGWVSWIAKANPAGVGLNVARISPGSSIAETSNTGTISFTNPSAGDPFVIESLPEVPYIRLDLSGPMNITNLGSSPQWAERLFSIKSLTCKQLFISGMASRTAYRGTVFGCRLGLVLCENAIGNEYVSPAFLSSLFGSSDAAQTGNCVLQVPAYCCLFGDGVQGVWISNLGASMVSTCLFQDCFVTSFAEFSLSNVQLFDTTSTSYGALSVYGTSCFLANVSGDGNAIGLTLRGSNIRYSGTFNLKGTIEARIVGTPNIDLTLAQALKPDDYAQKGEATLIAGTVTVTVPWYDNTTQKVMVTPNTPGGTPGNWTVTQPSNTQFTITSSSALDTSKVNWFITPLGKNIFIGTV